jgi:hypothetical protein
MPPPIEDSTSATVETADDLLDDASPPSAETIVDRLLSAVQPVVLAEADTTTPPAASANQKETFPGDEQDATALPPPRDTSPSAVPQESPRLQDSATETPIKSAGASTEEPTASTNDLDEAANDPTSLAEPPLGASDPEDAAVSSDNPAKGSDSAVGVATTPEPTATREVGEAEGPPEASAEDTVAETPVFEHVPAVTTEQGVAEKAPAVAGVPTTEIPPAEQASVASPVATTTTTLQPSPTSPMGAAEAMMAVANMDPVPESPHPSPPLLATKLPRPPAPPLPHVEPKDRRPINLAVTQRKRPREKVLFATSTTPPNEAAKVRRQAPSDDTNPGAPRRLDKAYLVTHATDFVSRALRDGPWPTVVDLSVVQTALDQFAADIIVPAFLSVDERRMVTHETPIILGSLLMLREVLILNADSIFRGLEDDDSSDNSTSNDDQERDTYFAASTLVTAVLLSALDKLGGVGSGPLCQKFLTLIEQYDQGELASCVLTTEQTVAPQGVSVLWPNGGIMDEEEAAAFLSSSM